MQYAVGFDILPPPPGSYHRQMDAKQQTNHPLNQTIVGNFGGVEHHAVSSAAGSFLDFFRHVVQSVSKHLLSSCLTFLRASPLNAKVRASTWRQAKRWRDAKQLQVSYLFCAAPWRAKVEHVFTCGLSARMYGTQKRLVLTPYTFQVHGSAQTSSALSFFAGLEVMPYAIGFLTTNIESFTACTQ